MSRGAEQGSQLRLRDLWAVPFLFVRMPLYAVDQQLVQRLPRDSHVRIVFDCGVGTVDIVAGHVLGDDGMTRYGIGRVQMALHPQPAVPTSRAPELSGT